MPVTIGTLGTGGLGANAVKPLRMVTPNATSASRWLEAAGTPSPTKTSCAASSSVTAVSMVSWTMDASSRI